MRKTEGIFRNLVHFSTYATWFLVNINKRLRNDESWVNITSKPYKEEFAEHFQLLSSIL